MKTLANIILIISMSSCGFLKREPIDINLNESNEKYVVEANLYEGTNDFNVILSKSTNYFKDETIPFVDGANVMVTDESGTITTLTESTSGNYTAKDFTAVPDQTYDLKINLPDGSDIEASSHLPKSVPILGMLFLLEEATAFGEEGYVPYTAFFDTPDEANFYRLIITINGERKDGFEDLFIFDDLLTVVGEPIIVPIFFERLSSGDEVTMELFSMDEETFYYLETISSIIGGTESAAPSNPENNLTNGALGNFSAFTASSVTEIVP